MIRIVKIYDDGIEAEYVLKYPGQSVTIPFEGADDVFNPSEDRKVEIKVRINK